MIFKGMQRYMRSREGKEGQEVLMGPGFLPPSWDLGSLIWGGESWEEEPFLPPSYLWLLREELRIRRLSVLTIQPCFFHQPTAFYFKVLGRCLGIILKFMLTTTVKIAAFTDMCLHLVSRKCTVWKITIS